MDTNGNRKQTRGYLIMFFRYFKYLNKNVVEDRPAKLFKGKR